MKLLEYKHKSDGNFCEGDSQQLFDLNCKRMPQNWKWKTSPVKYQLNSQGYRCPEWDSISWNDSIVLFGCSFVFGLGINNVDTCSHQLATLQTTNTVNLGRVGTSPMFQWANSCLLKDNGITPKAVIYVWPEPSRTTSLTDSYQATNHGVWNNKWCSGWTTHPWHGIEYLKHAITSVSYLWSCPVLHYHLDQLIVDKVAKLKYLDLGPSDHARDWNGKIAHPGPLTNKYWAEIMSNDLNGLW